MAMRSNELAHKEGWELTCLHFTWAINHSMSGLSPI